MKKIIILLTILMVFFVVNPTTADTQTEEMQTIAVSEALLQSTVIITVTGGGGSGFFISPNEIVSNHHVVNDAKSVFIKKSNGSMCLGDVVYTQKETDLALIKTDCEGKPLAIADNVKVGQSVLAMGNPLDQHWYVSKGIVGLVNNNGVLHDASIESGMSGGPVVNLNGQLVGVTKAVAKDMPRMSIAIDTKTLSYFLYKAKEG